VDDLWAVKSEDVGLIVRAISFQDFQPMWSWSTNVTDRRTDEQTTCDRKTALCTIVHRAVKQTVSRPSCLGPRSMRWPRQYCPLVNQFEYRTLCTSRERLEKRLHRQTEGRKKGRQTDSRPMHYVYH